MLADELRTSNRVAELALLNLARVENIARAQNTEIRWELRNQVLEATDYKESNVELRENLLHSRFSENSIFGSVPTNLVRRITYDSKSFKKLSFKRPFVSSGGGYQIAARSSPQSGSSTSRIPHPVWWWF